MTMKMTRYLSVLLLSVLLLPNIAPAADPVPEPVPPTPKVLGGTDTQPGSWPWMTALLDASEPDLYYAQYCGGVLVGANWVMTAAHCVDTANPGDIDVAVGARDLNNFSGSRIEVSAIVVHPDYDSRQLVNDIALLKLSSPSSVEPVTLFSGNSRKTSPTLIGQSTTLIGWGLYRTSSPYYPSILQQVDLPVVDSGICSSAFIGFTLTDSQLCAGYSSGKDACRGDSGGPLVMWLNDQWVHVGLVSYGSDCLQEHGFYGVYTRTSSFIDFISQYVPDLQVSVDPQPGLSWLLLLLHLNPALRK